jgi:hypothetical protein
MSTVVYPDRRDPNRFNLLQTAGMLKPEILKSKNISLRDVSANLDSTGQMIRGNPSKGKDHRKRKDTSPGNRSEKPINLLQKGGSLHVTPGIASTLQRQLNKAQVTDDIIEDYRILKITPSSIAVLSISIEVKVP